MRPTIFIYYLEGNSPESVKLFWRGVPAQDFQGEGQDNDLIDGEGYFSDFSEKYHQAKKRNTKKIDLVLLIPGHFITYTALDIPSKNKQQSVKAIPFLLEEFVIGDIDSMQISVGPSSIEGKIRSAVCDKELVEKWKSLFEGDDIFIESIFGIPDIISINKNQSCIVFIGDFVLYKSDKTCLQLACNNISVLYEILSIEDCEEIIIFSPGKNKTYLELEKTIKLGNSLKNIQYSEFSGEISDFFNSDDGDFYRDKINLRIGLSDSIKAWYLDSGLWKPIVTALFLLAVLQISINLSSGFYFNKRSNQIIRNAGMHYQQLFPDENLYDVSLQWPEKLKKSTVNDEEKTFHYIFPLVISEFLKNRGKNENHTFKLQQFSFNDDSYEARFNVNVSNISLLDTVRNSLLESGINLSVLSATEDKDFIKATILVSFP